MAKAMIDAGLLREIEPATSIVYEGCDERCLITPELIENSETGQVIGVYHCKRDGCGRITIEPDELRQWEPSFEAVASAVARAAELGASVAPVLLGRIYLLGTLPTGGGPLDVFLARGLAWDDARTAIESADRLRVSSSPVVLVAARIPPIELWDGLRPTVLSLAEHASWNARRASLALGGLPNALRSIRPRVPEERWLTVTECARLIANDLPSLTFAQAKARVSRAAGSGRLVTNGKTRGARRIERTSFDAWRLQQRDRDMDIDDDATRGTRSAARSRGRDRARGREYA
ncbi:MAG: hypothetical protein LC135_05240 [Phycisphaerae bacterium]|nr:hypothetical protein [Phycisphaerae bacterium]MCZ2399258.1 hypothetical protein [Phycisphaerae bacterium]